MHTQAKNVSQGHYAGYESSGGFEKIEQQVKREVSK